tara:strand:+ start:160 stop:444 length:285 start_codon:yes stop_codon:yes gene_type:complete
MNKKEITKRWTKVASDILVGRTIKKVAYLTEKEAEDDFGWHKRPITFTLDNGTIIIAQMDDEGNDGGVLLAEFPGQTMEINGKNYLKTEVLPVL